MRTLAPTGPPRQNRSIDYVLLTVILTLTIFGLVTVYSASSERSMADYGTPHKMFLNQFVKTLAGLGILLFTSLIPYRAWRKFAWPAVAGSAVFLLLIFISSMGYESHGARRWLTLGPIRFQPSEVAKFSIVLFIAAWAYNRGQNIKTFRDGILVPLGVAVVLVVLIALQPDFSTAAMIGVIAIILIFISGAKIGQLAVVFGPLAFAAALFVWLSPYRRARLSSYMRFGVDPEKADYQVLQSWIGFGRGGIIGVGAGESRQKLFFLPDAHTDFIYSIVGEEWGFVGAAALLLMVLVIVWRGTRIAVRCPDSFGGFLAVGFTFAIGLYALVNMAIATGVLPTTGLPLPFVSYGGTSLLMTYAVMGIVLNISRYGLPQSPAFNTGGRP